MKKHEILEALDRINEYSDYEVQINAIYIRNIAAEAYGLIQSLSRKAKSFPAGRRKES